MSEATPRPWYVVKPRDLLYSRDIDDSKGRHIALVKAGHVGNRLPGEANAALFVRAVNRDHHFAPLMEALTELVKEHDDRYDDDLKMPDTTPMREAREVLKAAEEAIA